MGTVGLTVYGYKAKYMYKSILNKCYLTLLAKCLRCFASEALIFVQCGMIWSSPLTVRHIAIKSDLAQFMQD